MKVRVLSIEQEPVAAMVCSRRLRKRIELKISTRKALKESREIAHSKLLRSPPREAASESREGLVAFSTVDDDTLLHVGAVNHLGGVEVDLLVHNSTSWLSCTVHV